MDTSRNQVRLKMIPRIDYTRKRGALKSSDDDADRKRKRWRPPQKLFDADTIRFVAWMSTFGTCRFDICSM